MMQLRLTQKASKVIRATIYPGVNAITLLIEKGDEDALKDADRLVPLVSFAVVRRGGAASSDYWDLATVLELSAIGNEWKLVNRILPKTLAAGKASWMIETTRDNLLLLKSARDRGSENVRTGRKHSGSRRAVR